MKAQILEAIQAIEKDSRPLRMEDWPDPVPADDEVLIKVRACGVCHTELDEIEGRTPPPHLPMILGHQAVGEIVAVGSKVTERMLGERVGVAWIFSACGKCEQCVAGRENLCPQFKATGRDVHGGYAELMTAPASFVHPIPSTINDEQAAPLLCAGAIGYRSLTLTNLVDGQLL